MKILKTFNIFHENTENIQFFLWKTENFKYFPWKYFVDSLRKDYAMLINIIMFVCLLLI